MFTGLIQHLGQVEKQELPNPNDPSAGMRVCLNIPVELRKHLFIGASLSVNGACMTIVELTDAHGTFDVSPESLSKTTLSNLVSGHWVNLELPLTIGAELGGHFVTGHVDGTATIESIIPYGNSRIYRFQVEQADLMPLIVEKGSIAIDGISLTVNTVIQTVFSVAIIPHTWEHTALKYRQPGDRINLETDLLGRYVQRLLVCGRIPGPAEQAGTPFTTGHIHTGLWFNGAPC